MRRQLHYDWHWFWSTGNGEIGNNGAHMIDIARWALGQRQPPPRAMSIGGRFAFHDDGETPNTQIVLLDYRPAPLVCEIRNLGAAKGAPSPGRFRNREGGVVIECEGGYLAGDAAGVTVFDKQGQKIKEFHGGRKPQEMEIAHVANFVAAVRSRKAGELNAEALEGHVSAACSHMGNISHRLGHGAASAAILETIHGSRDFSDAFQRCREHLQAVGVDLGATPAVVGPWVTLDWGQERFVGQFAHEANELSRRVYREPFVVPGID